MKCIYCGQNFTQELDIKQIFFWKRLYATQLCNSCASSFKTYQNAHTCKGCCKETLEEYCDDCLQWQKKYPEYVFRHQALFYYNDSMKAWFQEFKFNGNYRLRYTFSEELHNHLKKYKNFLIVPVPLEKVRMEKRGFNQVTALLQAANIEYQECLFKPVFSEEQSHKNRKERFLSRQPFELKLQEKITEKNILLMDDIYTTGRTMFYAAEKILAAKPKSLETFSLAR